MLLVWIEPVRDWNIPCISFKNSSFILCELNLWGIETSKIKIQNSIFLLCELNLWGIETAILQEDFSHF